MCEQCSEKQDDVNPERLDYCAQRIMSLQPDFCEQRLILEEAIIKAGHIFERYPKFHCECNFIERYWGFAKRETRRLCNYNYNDLLTQVLKVLISVPVTTIHKFASLHANHGDTWMHTIKGWKVGPLSRLLANISHIVSYL